MNHTEELVYQICRRSFLSLWSYANPRGKNGKELCDVLVVCDPDILIISVKEIELAESGDSSTNRNRWKKRAIDESGKQIYGAERWLRSASHVIKTDGTIGLPLPDQKKSNVYRIAIALGSKGKVPYRSDDFGKGVVHVFDEVSLGIVFQELDTVSDFVAYLSAKEAFLRSGKSIVFEGGGEEDLLALYLHNGRRFPDSYDVIIIDGSLWKGFEGKAEYRAKTSANKDSDYWDRIIGVLSREEPEIGCSLMEAEIALRVMAQEERFSRRVLGKAFMEFFEERKARSRMLVSPSGIAYVFLAVSHGTDLELLQAELGNRCFVARNLNPGCSSIVGVGTEYFESNKTSALILVYLHQPIWSVDDIDLAKRMQEELGYFVKPELKSVHEDEYPVS